MDKEVMDKLPDLPGLESVETSARALLAVGAVLVLLPVLFTVFAARVCMKYWDALGSQLPIAIIGGGVMLALALWMIIRLIVSDYRWKTDSEGLTARGLLRRRRVLWSDVVESEANEISMQRHRYRISTKQQSVVIDTETRFDSTMLITSIWQHLRRHGKAGAIKPSYEALSYWDIIPDQLPREMEWKNPKPSRRYLAMIPVFCLILTSIILSLIPSVRKSSDFGFIMFILLFYAVLVWFATRTSIAAADEVIITNDGISARIGKQATSLKWSDVVALLWKYPTAHTFIQVRGTKRRKHILVPFLEENEESQKLILTIIRHLRSLRSLKPISLPTSIRWAPTFPHADNLSMSQEVTLNMTRSDKIGCGVLGLMLSAMPALCLVSSKTVTGFFWQTLIWFGVIVLGCISATLSGLYFVKADSIGITMHWWFWKKSINWHDVGLVKVYMSPRYGERTSLKNSSGKTLVVIPPAIDTKSERQAFRDFVLSKVAESLPDELHQPWKAQPWQP